MIVNKNLPNTTTGTGLALIKVAKNLKIVNKLLSEVDILTEAHWSWWNKLPNIWKKALFINIKFADILSSQLRNTLEINWEDREFILLLNSVVEDIQIDENQLKKIFSLKSIYYYYSWSLDEKQLNCPFDSKSVIEMGNDYCLNYLPDFRYFKNLTNLTIWGCAIENLDNLKTAKNLIYLNLGENIIREISPLKNLKNLVSLSLWNNEYFIDDLDVLKDITTLRFLNLENMYIGSDALFLSKLLNLEELYIGSNFLQDLSMMKNLKNLKVLSVFANEIEDIEPITSLSNLVSINLINNELKSVKSLAQLKSLQKIELRGNPLAEDEIQWLKNKLPNCTIVFKENNILPSIPIPQQDDDWECTLF